MTRFKTFVTFVGQITSVAHLRTVLCEVNFREESGGGDGHVRGRDGAAVVSLPEIAGLLRRHLLAVLVVLAIAAGVEYTFKHSAATYAETATMVFVPPESGVHPNPFAAVGGSLTEVAGVVAAKAMSPQEQQQVARAGGTGSYDVGLIDDYNLQYPSFSSPYLTVTTSSPDPTAANRTFTVLSQVLTNQFMAQQTQDGVLPNSRIQIVVAGDTGPLIQQGSPKRVLIGLIILTIVAVFGVAAFFDRHPVRLSRLGRGQTGSRRRVPGLSGISVPIRLAARSPNSREITE
jgi:hypothetical protein